MNALTLVWLIYLLIVASAWMACLVIASGIAWCIYKGWIWFKAWRAERQLRAARHMRAGFKAAERMGWIPEDKQ